MKKIFTILVVAFVALIGFTQKGKAQSTMVFEKSVYDFGDIQERDGVVSCVFNFTNEGTTPFVIENVSVSCGCTTPEYLKKPVMPGEKRTIKVSFDPEGRSGEFIKDIYITSNNRQNRNTLQIKGNITARARTLKDEYPYELTSGVRLNSMSINFRYAPDGKLTTMSVKVLNSSEQTISLEAISETDYILTYPPLTLGAGERGELNISYDFREGESWGMYSGKLKLKVNGKLQNFELSTTAICVDDFTLLNQIEFEDPARADFSTQFCDFGKVKRGDILEKEILLYNKGGHDLKIRKVDLPQNVTTTLKAGDTVKAGESIKVKIETKTTLEDVGRLNKSIVVLLNDPLRPMRELRISAIVE